MRILFLSMLMCFLIQQSIAQEKRFAFSEIKMGSPLSIIFYDDDSLHAATVAKNCYGLVDSLVGIFSDYIDTSELSRLSQSAGTGKYIKLSPAMYDIMMESRKAWKKSDGAFDISVAPLVRLWRQARKDKKIPAAELIREKKKLVGFQHIKFRKSQHSVQLKLPGMQLDLGGIAQGYIGQQVLYRLNQFSITRALVDVSGDIVMSGSPPGKDGWTIGINLPGSTYKLQNKTLILSHSSVSTSGDVYQYIEENGIRYSHIVDPTTGYGVTLQRNVTIIAPDATVADWLATSCSILSEKKAGRLARKMHASLLIATIENGEIKLFGTGRFENYRP